MKEWCQAQLLLMFSEGCGLYGVLDFFSDDFWI